MRSHLLARLAAAALAAFSASVSYAQPANLLGDLVPGGFPEFDDFGVRPIGVVNGKALLHAPSPGALWASDGTAAGTVGIADLAFGGGSFALTVASSPRRFYVLVDGVGRVNGARVLRTDGTRPGTFFLRDATGAALVPLFQSRPAGSNGRLYLTACAETRCGIWFNNGASPVSQLLVPLDPSASIGLALVTLGDSVYWSRDSQLMASRPAQPGPRLVFGSPGGPIRGLTVLGGRLVFAASSTAGDEVWSSNGTSATVLTAFANPAPFVASNGLFHATAGRAYFLADDGAHGQELWSTDGSVAGTRRETDFELDQPFGFQELPEGKTVAVVADKLFFVAADGVGGTQLWVRKGAAPPVPLLDPCGEGCSPLSFARGLIVANGRIFFGAADPDHGYEMWSSDGTKAGTRLLVDSCPGSCSGFPLLEVDRRVFAAGNRVFFWTLNDLWATDGSPELTYSVYHAERFLLEFGPRLVVPVGQGIVFPGFDPNYGAEVFVSDGSARSAQVLAELISSNAGSGPQTFTSFGSGALFSAVAQTNPGDVSLWITDGTPAGTAEVAGTSLRTCDSSGRLCPPFVVAGKHAFFVQQDDQFRPQLWRTDGTAGGNLQLTQLPDGLAWDLLTAVSGETLYFVGPGSTELWSTDGTVEGTDVLFTVPETSGVTALSAIGGELYFMAVNDFVSSAWHSDGTLAGTTKLMAFGSGPQLTGPFVGAGDTVWFMTIAGGVGQLWGTDGTAAGTRVVANPNVVSDLVSLDGTLFFFAQASPSERALWRVNAQGNGIDQVARFPGTGFGITRGAWGLTVFQGKLYFVASSAATGPELWRSDGTAGGTSLVRDINPGIEASDIETLSVGPDALYFTANDGVHGPELWRSDGTGSGTQLVQDLWPGPVGSNPTTVAVAGSHLVFGATDQTFGREPWTLDLLATRTCVPPPTALCLRGGRFQVTAAWEDFQGHRGVGHAVPLTADTGYFWFFGEDNVEVVVKVLDGHSANDHDWVFYGALSSVEYSLTVTDVTTGAVRRYFNPSGRLASVGDTHGFGPLGAYSRMPPPAGGSEASVGAVSSGDTSPCVASATRLCLNGGRFAVEGTWKDFDGNTGVAHAVGLTADTGYLWFFTDNNVEVVIKILDARPVNGKFWLFYGALSSVEYALTVRDTITGNVRTYRNPSGRMASVADVAAF